MLQWTVAFFILAIYSKSFNNILESLNSGWPAFKKMEAYFPQQTSLTRFLPLFHGKVSMNILSLIPVWSPCIGSTAM